MVELNRTSILFLFGIALRRQQIFALGLCSVEFASSIFPSKNARTRTRPRARSRALRAEFFPTTKRAPVPARDPCLGHADRRGPLRAYTTRGQAQDERLQAAAARPAAGCPGRLRGRHQDRKVNSIGVSTTTEVHASRSGVASGSGGRAAD